MEKLPVCGSPVGKNALLMLEVRGEWGRLIQADRRATLTEITTRYNRGMQQSICVTTPLNALKQLPCD